MFNEFMSLCLDYLMIEPSELKSIPRPPLLWLGRLGGTSVSISFFFLFFHRTERRWCNKLPLLLTLRLFLDNDSSGKKKPCSLIWGLKTRSHHSIQHPANHLPPNSYQQVTNSMADVAMRVMPGWRIMIWIRSLQKRQKKNNNICLIQRSFPEISAVY